MTKSYEELDFSDAGDPAVFQREVFLERADDDMGLARTLVEVFESDWPMLRTSLQSAVSAGDATEIERAAHTLKGAVGVFGAETAHRLAAELEAIGHEGRMGEARLHIDALVREVEQLAAALRAFVDDVRR